MAAKIEQLGYWKKMVFLMGFLKIPMIGYLAPKVLQVDEKTIRVRIRLRRRSKNHLNSMYFGALAVGADLCAGLHAFYFSEKANAKVSFAFKSMKGEFLKRAETDVLFVCDEGYLIHEAVEKSRTTGERVNQEVKVNALNTAGEIVAIFHMESSVKVKAT